MKLPLSLHKQALSVLIASSTLCLAAVPAHAAPKPCEDLKKELAAKLEAQGVKGYSLEAVAVDDTTQNKPENKVVGTCDSGSKKLIYKKN
ncbi:MAG: DUF1161 domain-containing protein [Leptothrix ochracea]|uniref:DUF1161 domain-containing protein n=1 Tax=Leptothrix ochracea TaxID=735331 RepID=UPI0034E2A67C